MENRQDRMNQADVSKEAATKKTGAEDLQMNNKPSTAGTQDKKSYDSQIDQPVERVRDESRPTTGQRSRS